MSNNSKCRISARTSAIRLAIAAAGVTATLATSAVLAAPLYLSEIRDSELGEMRGRYVSASHVLFFGVEMYTRWQTADGGLHTAGLRLDVDLSKGGLPTTSFRPVVSLATVAPVGAVGNGNNAQVNGAGLNNIAGIVQGIQVAGDSNQVENNLRLNVTTGADPSGLPAGEAGTTAASARNGDSVAMANAGQNGLGVAIDIAGQGRVLQQIRTGGQGIVQSVQLVSGMNQIQNVMQINAGLRAVSGLSTARIGEALQNLRGIPVQGVY